MKQKYKKIIQTDCKFVKQDQLTTLWKSDTIISNKIQPKKM